MKHASLVLRILFIAGFYLGMFTLVDFLFFFSAPHGKPGIGLFFHTLLIREKPNLLVFLACVTVATVFFLGHRYFSFRQRASLKSEKINTDSDSYGVVETMYKAPIHSHIHADSLIVCDPSATMSTIVSAATTLSDDERQKLTHLFTQPDLSDLERDIFRLLYYYRAWPADVTGYHGVTLLQHTLSVWSNAAEKQGVGSVSAQLAAAHDLGKILAYKPASKPAYTTDDSQKFIRVSLRHTVLNLIVLRRLPSFSCLDTEKRRNLIASMTAMTKVSGVVPDLPMSDHSVAARAALASDVKATAMETTVADERAGASLNDDEFLDLLVVAFTENLLARLTKLNINRSRDQSRAAQGFSYISGPYVMIPAKYVRQVIKNILPEPLTERLRLNVDSGGDIHPSTPTITAALLQGGFISPSFEGHAPPDALFNFRSGKNTFKGCYLFSSDRFPQNVIENWGDWSFEAELIKK